MAEKGRNVKIIIIVSLFAVAAVVTILLMLSVDEKASVAVVKESYKAPATKVNKLVKNGTSKSPSVKEVMKDAELIIDKPLSPLDNPDDAGTLSKILSMHSIKHNPFRVNETVTQVHAPSNIPRMSQLKVSAIGINKDSKMVIINNTIYGLGDVLFGHYTLSKATMTSVTLTDPTGKVSILSLY